MQTLVLGIRIEIVFLSLPSPQIALRRIAARVRQGGHNVPHVARVARKTARIHGTLLYFWRDGKVVAEKP